MSPIRFLLWLLVVPCCHIAIAQIDVDLPDDLTISRVADDSLVPNCYTITTNDKGQIYASGPGYIRLLLDDDDDGEMDRFKSFSDLPKSGAQGLYVDDNTIYAVGDKGVLRFADADDDNIADGPPELVLPIRAGGEHHAHSLRKGPDGWWYLIGGNHTDEEHVLLDDPSSAVTFPRAGAIWRISPDWKTRGIWCHGFRNAYDFDFLRDGSIAVYDSDGERDVTLPWYRPTRVFRASAGSDAGWASRSWKQPNHYFDSPTVLADLGRGSPTGVVAGWRTSLPERLQSSVIVLDWTFGRVISVALDGSEPEVIASPLGTMGFAVTDVDVGKDGSLLVSVGGRGTTGSIYRISARATHRHRWSRKQQSANVQQIESINEAIALIHNPNVNMDQLHLALTALGLANRREEKLLPANWHGSLSKLASSDDKETRRLAGWVASCFAEPLWNEALANSSALGKLTLWLGRLEAFPVDQIQYDAFLAGLSAIESSSNSEAIALSGMRLITLAMGDLGTYSGTDTRSSIDRASVFDGYRSKLPPKLSRDQESHVVRALVAKATDSNQTISDEAIRLMAVLQTEASTAVKAVVAEMAKRSHPSDKLHCLIALGRLRGQRSDEQTTAIAQQMLEIPIAIASRGLHLERNFQPRMRELWEALTYQDLLLEPAIVSDGKFGESEHLLWAEMFRPESTKLARQRYLKRHLESQWPIDVARFVAASYTPLPRPLIRKWLSSDSTKSAGLIALSQHPRASDLETLTQGIDSFDSLVTSEIMQAVEVIARDNSEAAINQSGAKALWLLANGNSKDKNVKRAQTALCSVLKVDWGDVKTELANRFDGFFGTASPATEITWKQRLLKIDWSAGDRNVGSKVFEKARCNLCHGGRKALGPNLAGISKRFSREDLLAAIYAPSRNISDRYRAKHVITEDGRSIVGFVIYQSIDGLTLLDAEAKTHRVNKDDIADSRPSTVSLMPAGLIDELSDEDIANLIAYMQSL